MNRQNFMIIFGYFVFTVALTGCDARKVRAESDAEFRPKVDMKTPTRNDVKTPNKFWVDCPLNVYEAGESDTGIPFKISGLCPPNSPQKIILSTALDTQLSAEFSSFTVTDSQYTTTNLSNYFSFDKATNNFFISANDASKMWASLPKGEYSFSANPISEDFEFAADYGFEFEIR